MKWWNDNEKQWQTDNGNDGVIIMIIMAVIILK